MKKFTKLIALIGIELSLSACAMSSQSTVGVSCDYPQYEREGLSTWQWPIVCQPNGG